KHNVFVSADEDETHDFFEVNGLLFFFAYILDSKNGSANTKRLEASLEDGIEEHCLSTISDQSPDEQDYGSVAGPHHFTARTLQASAVGLVSDDQSEQGLVFKIISF